MVSARVVPVPCLQDNYAYVVHAAGSALALVVDPSEHEPVLAALQREGLSLGGILLTHHHYDHIGGVDALVAATSRQGHELPVVCSRYDLAAGRIPKANRGLSHRSSIVLADLEIVALEVPGHTLGAVAYLIGDAVFTGDTLFIAGCGRLFEGTPAQMFVSLRETLGALPPSTKVYCGHEYTRQNARFASVVEPENLAVRALLERAGRLAEKNLPTVPSTIGDELSFNPFLRTSEPHIVGRYPADSAVGVLAAIRAAKDAFR